MSTYELYLGGARQQNANFGMLPAAPFAASTVFQPAIKQQPNSFFLSRTFNFGVSTGPNSDVALSNFVSNLVSPLASGDILGAVVIPTSFAATGFYWSIDNVLAGGSITISTRVGGTALLTTQSTATVASGYIAWPSGPVYFAPGAGDIIDAHLVTVPGGGIGKLAFTVGVVGVSLQHPNY